MDARNQNIEIAIKRNTFPSVGKRIGRPNLFFVFETFPFYE